MKAEKLAKVLFPDLPVISVLTFLDSALFTVSGECASPLTNPTHQLTLSLAQQGAVAKPYLQANSTFIERQTHEIGFGCQASLLLDFL